MLWFLYLKYFIVTIDSRFLHYAIRIAVDPTYSDCILFEHVFPPKWTWFLRTYTLRCVIQWHIKCCTFVIVCIFLPPPHTHKQTPPPTPSLLPFLCNLNHCQCMKLGTVHLYLSQGARLDCRGHETFNDIIRQIFRVMNL